ncbi:MAG: DUF1203 domain-containing protein, partial [Candidatus Eremiobacteraeota bacterium]|nr:DUF1203 domain-containing protein [Candidatus Eremiobacteraeota bacterium]
NAYAEGRKLIGQAYAASGDIDSVLERLLARPEVSYVHVRDTEAGCYDFRIERTEATS